MEIPRSARISDGDRRTQRVEDDLHLDKIVATQPEIGPTPPDGGYGWLIVVSAMIYYVTAPGLLVMYGFIILKSIKDDDHDEGDKYKVWDVDIALVPVLMVVMKLLLESWCRAVVKLFNMPRFMALAGLCLSVAGVLLSSYSTDANANNVIINIFAGIFAGAGCALTTQQTEVIITHYFRDKILVAQRIVRIAPVLGNCFIPVFIGFLCSNYNSDVVVMIYAATLMQNCLFLASYTRPIYIERVLRSTYKMLRDAVEDEDEVIFSNASANQSDHRDQQGVSTIASGAHSNRVGENVDDADDHIVVFNSRKNAKEILDPSVQFREKTDRTNRFSSDFSTIYDDEAAKENRFSSDFGILDMNGSYQNDNRGGYRELQNIDRIAQDPQPLYRDTTVDTPVQHNIAFVIDPSMATGTVRRQASLKKNFFVVVNMLKDLNFYLYTLLHLSTTFSVLIFAVILPPLIWEQNPSYNIWKVSVLISFIHIASYCLVMLCGILPKRFHERFGLSSIFCLIGAIGFYGVTMSSHTTFLFAWGTLASSSLAASYVISQPLYNNALSEFDETVTITTASSLVATFIMIWCISFNYEYRTCFFTASVLQAFTCLVSLLPMFKVLPRVLQRRT